MKFTKFVTLSLSLLALNVYAQDDYARYEKAVNSAKAKAAQSLKTKDPKQISTAHYQLAALQSEAREKGHTCDFAYLFEIVENVQVAADNSPWFQATLPTLPVYKKNSGSTLSLQLIAAGLVKGKSMTREAFVKALNSITVNSAYVLYKPVPGVMPLGSIEISKGKAIDVSYLFTDEGEFKTIRSAAAPAEFKIINGEINLLINKAPSFILTIDRDGKPSKDVRSTDNISIQGVDSDDFNAQLFLTPDECSA